MAFLPNLLLSLRVSFSSLDLLVLISPGRLSSLVHSLTTLGVIVAKFLT